MMYYSQSASETRKIAGEFAKKLHRGAYVGLFGELGSGKTTFVQGMAEGLGIKSSVTSPTFTLVNEYTPLVHVDLYRIDDPKEVLSLGLEDYADQIVVIEWAEKFPKKLDFRVTLKNTAPEGREIGIV